MKKKIPTAKPVVTDLGLIRVTSTGLKDRVEITASGKVAFIAVCHPGKASQLTVNKESWALADREWADIVTAYVHWKRKQIPNLKFPRGHLTDGGQHPWRAIVNTERKGTGT